MIVLWLKSYWPFLMLFHRLVSKDSLTSQEIHLPSIFPNFLSMIFLHKLSLWRANHNNHLLSEAQWSISNLLIPKPRNSLQTLDQLTKCILLPSQRFPHKKFLWIFSNLFIIFLGIAKRDIKWIGKLERMLLMRTNLLPLDNYCFFQEANLLLNLSSTESHTIEDLWGAPKGKPK